MQLIKGLGIVVVLLCSVSYAQAREWRAGFGMEHGALFPASSAVYDNNDTVYFWGIKEGLYWVNGWGVELSQRFVSPQNEFLGAGASTGERKKRANGLYHLRYNLPLGFLARYDFQKRSNAFFRPYIGAGISLYYTVKSFEETEPPTLREKDDRQWSSGPLLMCGVEIFPTRGKAFMELKYELFELEETFSGSGDNGTGGGLSLSVGVSF
jgi:hypothetical protein